MGRPTLVLAAIAGGLLSTAAAPAEAAPAGQWSCSASALRGSVLGVPLGTTDANATPGAACAKADGSLLDTTSLGLPVRAGAVTAATRVVGGSIPREQQVFATGGITQLRVSALPASVQGLVDGVLAQVPAVTVPVLNVSLDLRPAVAALLTTPNLDLLSADAITSTAVAGCANGVPQTAGVTQVANLRVLGQPVGEGLVDQTLNLLNTERIDLSRLDLSKVQLPLGLSLGVVQPLLQPVLDALPDIAVPAALARLQVTPAQQDRQADGTLVQRGLRIEASVLGQSLVDLTAGEASVGGAVDCTPDAIAPAGPDAADLVLGCTDRDVVLVDVVPVGGRVRLYGVADKRFAGRRVAIRSTADGRVVARPTVLADGTFRASAPLPPRRLRATNRARYRASVGDERSLDLKLERRLRVSDVRSAGGQVTITGQVTGPLARRARDRTITVQRRVTCRRSEVVAKVFPRADGRFTARFAAPRGASAAVYRLQGRVRVTERSAKLFPTFTLPRAVDLV
jgi:hypothetical protein